MKSDRPKTILILGAGIMQIPAIRLAKQKDWRVIVADINSSAPGVKLADHYECVDLKDREGMARMAAEYKARGGLDGVFTAGTDFSTTVAWVAEKCGFPGISYEVALNATDKVRMRSVLKNANVPCPDFRGLTADDDPGEILEDFPLPIVLKPVDSMGARGVRKVDSISSLRPAFESALLSSRVARVIVEVLMEGPELSMDAVIYRGEITVCGVADRIICFPPYFVEMGHTMPSNLDADLLEQAVSIFKKGIKALGIDNGAAKGDIKVTPQGVMVGEIAARLSGGYMSGWTFPYSSGIEVTEAALKIAVGLPPGDLEPCKKSVSAERAFISIPGRIKEISGLDEIENTKGINNVFIRTEPQEDVVFPKNNMEKCGNVISEASNREQAVLLAEDACRRVFLRLETSNPNTEAFLNRNVGESDYTAFRITNPRILSVWESMPLRIDGGKEIAVLNLPGLEEEQATDWHGLGIRKAYEKVKELTGIPVVNSDTSGYTILGSRFWRAFLRGGIQGGVYVIDTERERLNNYRIEAAV